MFLGIDVAKISKNNSKKIGDFHYAYDVERQY
jgi:hypothetical protein